MTIPTTHGAGVVDGSRRQHSLGRGSQWITKGLLKVGIDGTCHAMREIAMRSKEVVARLCCQTDRLEQISYSQKMDTFLVGRCCWSMANATDRSQRYKLLCVCV